MSPPSILLAGLPPEWGEALVSGWPEPAAFWYVADGRDTRVAGAQPCPLDERWSQAAAALPQLGVEFDTVIVAADCSPAASSLDEALDGLELAVERNVLAPIRLLSSLLPRFLERRAGRILILAAEPSATRAPEHAALRASARGLLTYAESLRPALSLRGVSLGTLRLKVRGRNRTGPVPVSPRFVAQVHRAWQKQTLDCLLTLP